MHRLIIDTPKPLRLMLAVLATLMLTLCPLQQADAKKTVVIACDWDFAPYEFINSNNQQPDGYIVEVLDKILNQLNIPHKFEMNARRKNITSFRNGQSDLIIDYRNRFNNDNEYPTLTSLGYYSFCLAHKKEKPDVSTREGLMSAGTVVFNNSNDSVAQAMMGDFADSIKSVYCSPREGLSGISTGDYDYFFWGEEPTKWKLKEYNLPDIVTNSFDLYASEIHIIGHDKQLIENIDNQFARMQQKGEIDRISDQWFHPERVAPKASPIVLYLTIAVLLLAIVAAIIYYLTQMRVRAALRKNEDMEKMMHKALSMSNYSVIINDLRHGTMTNLHGDSLPIEGMKEKEFFDHVHPDDLDTILNHQKSAKAKNGNPVPYSLRWNKGTPEQPQWVSVAGFTFPEFDNNHNPVDIVISSRNITEEQQKEKAEQEMALRYQKMFDTTLVAMSFYDKNGFFVDMSQKMRELCNIDSEEKVKFLHAFKLFDLDMFKEDFNKDNPEAFHVCQHLVTPEIGVDKYVEVRVRSSHDEEGNILYYVVTARDVSKERDMYLELSRQDKALQKASETNTHYEKEMRDLMENCNMYIWRLNMSTNTITLSRSMNHVDFTRTLQEYVDSMYEEDRVAATETIRNLTRLDKAFNMIHHFRYTPISDKPTWQAISGMPLTDSEGNVTEFFGLIRDVSSLMEAQERLKEETARAENSGILKSTFLANMSHEIRTPLNAIVGFSDLLQMVGTTEERQEFIRIIHNNCDMLNRLVNDILEASNMDVKPLEIKPAKADFAKEFDIISQSLQQRVQEPGVQFIAENPYTSFITVIDMGRMQQVITNFVTNAVKYTRQGHIRVSYDYRDGGIYMFCEDTGAGIPKDKQKRVFDRFVKLNDFVQGTGLGLSICKSIAERSGGRIGLDSEGDGTGSTFWIWVPCPKMDGSQEK